MPPTLSGRNDPTLALDRPRPQQHLPMQLPRWHRESGRIDERLCALPFQRQAGFRKTQVEAYQQPQLAHTGVEWRDNLHARLDTVALLEDRAVRPEVDVEEMQLLVAMGDGAIGVDPDEGVGDAGRGRHRGFVDADVDGQGMGASGPLESLDEWRAGDRETQGNRFRGRGGDVVGCFREEQRLQKKWLCEETVNNGLDKGVLKYMFATVLSRKTARMISSE